MSTHLATIDSPLGLRARGDVLASAVPVAGRNMWVVKDPLTLEQYQLSLEEFALLERLRQPASLRDLQRHFDREFAPATAKVSEIWRSLARLHNAGLLIGSLPGQGDALAERDRQRTTHERRWAWTRLLALRLRGINPDKGLDAVMQIAGPLLSWPALLLAGLVVIAAASLLLTHAGELVERLPTLGLLMTPANWPWMILAVLSLKVLHELGHALMAKRLGAEVPEMGIMLLVFLPCLYCDVSDIWRLPSKWQRMAVSAAGMGVELLVASIATFVWWLSEPGLVNLLALNVMIAATVGTVAINANPLLRYDGYYLLSDLAEIPNLWQRSREALQSRWSAFFFRPPRHEQQLPREPLWLAGYALLSKGYLVLVMLAIFFSLVTLLAPRGLQVVAYAMGGVMMATQAATTIGQVSNSLKSPLRRSQFRPLRAGLFVIVVTLTAAGLLRWPLVDWVHCQATVVPREATRIVTTLDGRLEFALSPGTAVEAGDVVIRLSNDRINRQLSQFEASVAVAERRLAGLMALRSRDPESSAKIPAARKELEQLTAQLERHRDEAQRLALRAPIAGRVLAPPSRTPEKDTGQLPNWSGTPLERQNLGAWLEVGTLVALVVPTDECQVMIAIDERDIELVAPGQPARVQLAQQGGRVTLATVTEIARRGSVTDEQSPQTMGLARFVPNPLAATTPGSRFEAQLVPTEPLVGATLDGGGRAKIETGRTPLGVWLMRELRDTFRLP